VDPGEWKRLVTGNFHGVDSVEIWLVAGPEKNLRWLLDKKQTPSGRLKYFAVAVGFGQADARSSELL
jgi:hypothetical protein